MAADSTSSGEVVAHSTRSIMMAGSPAVVAVEDFLEAFSSTSVNAGQDLRMMFFLSSYCRVA